MLSFTNNWSIVLRDKALKVVNVYFQRSLLLLLGKVCGSSFLHLHNDVCAKFTQN